MGTKTGIAVAVTLAIFALPHAMAQTIALNGEASLAASQDVSSRKSPRSTHLQHRQSRNAGLGTDGYAPLSSPQAPKSGYDPNWPADNYQYWREACCM